jgi:hypothetical protein
MRGFFSGSGRKLNSDIRALGILFCLVLTTLAIFSAERKYLVAQPRGSQTSAYESLPWKDKILLLVEDFEKLENDTATLHKANFFNYGSVLLGIDKNKIDHTILSGNADLKNAWKGGKENYGGWGKGVGQNLDLDEKKNYFTFRFYNPKNNGSDFVKIVIQEDDNDDGIYQADKDDEWAYKAHVAGKDEWQIISIPLRSFYDNNKGGDGKFNVTKKGGIHNVAFSFEANERYSAGRMWYFDFICFTSEKITAKDKNEKSDPATAESGK